MEHGSGQSAAPVCAPCQIVSRYVAQCQPAPQPGYSNPAQAALSVYSTLCLAAAVFCRLSVPHDLVVHLGFGVFNDIIPAQIADMAATNAPNAATFVGGIGGQVGGVALAPGVPNSAADAASSANRQFQSAFSSGAAPCADRRGRADVSSGSEPEYLPHRQAQDALLLPVQPRPGTAAWSARRRTHQLRRHPWPP